MTSGLRGMKGLFFYMNAIHAWKEIELPSPFGEITSCDVEKSGNAWVGTSSRGIFLIDKYNFSFFRLPLSRYLRRKRVYERT
mgnify:CR=1 FL=1